MSLLLRVVARGVRRMIGVALAPPSSWATAPSPLAELPSAVEARSFSLAAALCRRRRRTKQRKPNDRCPECPGPPRHPLCYEKRSQCPQQIPKCPPLRKCRKSTCNYVDPRKMAEAYDNSIEDEQMAQAREERRLRMCYSMKAAKCCKKRKKQQNVWEKRCPKDYSDPRHCD